MYRRRQCRGLSSRSTKWNEKVSRERKEEMGRYGKKATKKVKRAKQNRKKGTLRSGRSGKKVTSRKQAIAIGLSEARKSGAKVPRKNGTSRKRTARKS